MKIVADPFEVALDSLSPLIDNPRTLDDTGRDRLGRSLDRLGLYKPLVVWRDPETLALTILAGNQRADLLRSREVESVQVVEFEGSRAEARAVALRDNNEDGEWEWESLSRYLAKLDDLSGDDFEWEFTGFDSETVGDLLALATAPVEPTSEPTSDPIEVEHDPTEGGADPALPTNYVESRFVNATIGNLRGRIPLDVYSRFTKAWSLLAEEEGTTDVPALVERLVERLGG